MGQKGALPRSASRSCDLLNIDATEAVRNGKIRDTIAFDFEHGYQMWIWFVNFLVKKNKN